MEDLGLDDPSQTPPVAEASGEPVVQNGDAETHAATSTEQDDAIQEKKQRAQEVMARSSAGLGGDSQQETTRSISKSKSPAPIAAEHTDTPPLSRKRSRSGSRIPREAPKRKDSEDKSRPSRDELLLNQYYNRDQLATSLNIEQREAQRDLKQQLGNEYRQWLELRKSNPRDIGMLYGEGFSGYGNGWTARYPSRIIYPSQRKRPANRKTRQLRISRQDQATQADQLEDLVPIRLDLEFEKLRLRDTFTWNVHDRVVPVNMFAEGLVEDFQIPQEAVQTLTRQVFENIQEQIADYHPHIFLQQEPLEPSLPYFSYKNDELRVLIKLNITIGQHTLVDQFDWDINNPENSPEEFAKKMAADMSLSGEFMTAIAHQIREQAQMFTKSLYIANHPFDGRGVDDTDVKDNLLPSPLHSSFRPYQAAKDFAPYFYELNEADVERTELAFSREQRQQKRSVNRRGGPSLPDLKERLRTVRTMVTSSVVPGAAESVQDSGIYKPVRSASGRGRRSGYRADQGEESELSESDESGQDSPARNILQGTSRTRGMRGAATAAQQALKQSYAARSVTPEHLSLHHHETRTLARRIGQQDTREESASEPTTMVVKLKMPREKYRQWLREYKAAQQRRQIPPHQQQQHHQTPGRPPAHQPAYSGSPYQHGNNAPYGAAMGPPPTSVPTPQQQAQQRYMQHQHQQQAQGHPMYPGQFQRPPSGDPNQQMQQQQRYPPPDGGMSGSPHGGYAPRQEVGRDFQ